MSVVLQAWWVVLFMLAAVGASAEPAPAGRSIDIPAWAQQQAIPVRIDQPNNNAAAWQALAGIAGSARVIGFAEAAHMQPEYLRLRNAFFEYLVQSAGVTAIAAETSYIKSIEVDDYVQGKGPEPATAETIHRVFSWAPLAATENRELIEWMRAYNARPATKRSIRFYGIDLTGYRPGEDLYQQARVAVDAALAYVGELDRPAAAALAARLEPALGSFNKSGYARLSPLQRDALTSALVDLENLFGQRRAEWLSKTQPLQYQRALRSAILARQHDADFRADPEGRGSSSAREVAMADNVQWVLEQEGAQGRILLFASGNHLTKGPNAPYRNEQLGAQLHHLLGKNYVAIGSYWRDPAAHGEGKDQGPVLALLLRSIAERVAAPNFLIDLRNRPQDPRWTPAGAGAAAFFDAMLFLQPRVQPHQW